MKKETLEYLIDLVQAEYDEAEYDEEKYEGFNGLHVHQAEQWQRAKDTRLAEMRSIIEELTEELDKE